MSFTQPLADLLTWATASGGASRETPSAGLQAAGFSGDDPVPNGIINALFGRLYDMVGYMAEPTTVKHWLALLPGHASNAAVNGDGVEAGSITGVSILQFVMSSSTSCDVRSTLPRMRPRGGTVSAVKINCASFTGTFDNVDFTVLLVDDDDNAMRWEGSVSSAGEVTLAEDATYDVTGSGLTKTSTFTNWIRGSVAFDVDVTSATGQIVVFDTLTITFS